MAISDKQREERSKGIGGSDAPAILGASPFKTPLAVWLDKTRGPEPEAEMPLVVDMGTALEGFIAERWTKETGQAVMEAPDTLVHPEYEFIRGNVDRLLMEKDEGLELKFVAFRQDDWGDAGTDLVPPYVHLQCDHYMLVTGYARWHVGALFGARELRCYTIERDDAIMAKLFQLEQQFWQMVLDGVQPPMMTPADISRMYPRDTGLAVAADVNIEQAIATMRHAKQEAQTWADLATLLEAQIKLYMADNSTLTDSMGVPLATWRKSRDCTKFDKDRFRATHPELFAQFQIPAPGTRRFLLKGEK